MKTLNGKIWNDAGLLREYFAERNYGQVLEFGGSYTAWKYARRIIARIVKLTGESWKHVQSELLADYQLKG